MKAPMYINTNYCDVVSRERTYKKHLQQLEAIKKKKNPIPYERISMLDNLKLIRAQNMKFLRSEKEDNIQKENHILLGHIIKIGIRENPKGTPGDSLGRIQTSPNRSKKSYLRKVEEDRIKTANLKLAQRLLEVDMNSNKLWDNNHMEYHKRIGKTLRKLHETPDRKVVIKSVESNRRNLNRIKLPPVNRDRSYNASKMSGDETTMEDSHTLRKVNKTVADYSQMYDSVNQPQFTQNGEETEFEQTNGSYY